MTDGRPAQLTRFVPALVGLAALFGALELLAYLAFGFVQLAVEGALFTAYGLWLLLAWRRAGTFDAGWFVARLGLGMLGIIIVTAILQPQLVPELTVATAVPVIAVLPYLGDRPLRRFIALTWVAGVFVALMGEAMPGSMVLPPLFASSFRILAMGLAFGLALYLLWQFSSRLKSTARELGNLADLSSDLSRTMDPLRIGDLMAEHLARATDAAEAGICYWDPANDRVLTYGYFPRERRAVVDEAYPLADYPATRRLLLDQTELAVRVDDDTADPAEVAYLRSIGMGAMVMLPLIARGKSIGTIELYATGGLAFDERRLRLARSLADEAAMALDNARLVEELRHQAFHDGLTGLANRGLFRDRVEHALARNARAGGSIAVLFLDLDDFKTVNDRFGHPAGDELLQVVSGRLVEVLRPGDTAARLGGDEFAVLLEDLTGPEDARLVADRLIDAVRTPIRLGDADALTGASVGIATATAGNERAEDLLRNADFAMYRAKSAGKGRHELFQSHMRDGIAERAELEGLIVGAVERNELRVQYQPVVELATRTIVGVEALVRWHPAGHRMLMPGDFISLAEETGQIVAIGRWVAEEACRQTRVWQDRLADPAFLVSINLSARQFQHAGLVGEVLAAVRAAGIAPASVVLEITESVLMQHTASTIEKLAELRAHGIRLAIDDFGTGYSSLSYLDRFPVDTLKIDRTFVDGFGAGREGPVLVRAIIELGQALGLEVVAEGIERDDQVGPLVELGCRLGQGYLFARPMDATAIDALLAGPAADADTELNVTPLRSRHGSSPAAQDRPALPSDSRRTPVVGGPSLTPATGGLRRTPAPAERAASRDPIRSATEDADRAG